MSFLHKRERRFSGARFLAVLVTLAAVVAATASTATARSPLARSSEIPEINGSDVHLTDACGVDVSATFSGLYEETLFFKNDGSVDRQVDSFDGEITWHTEAGASYASTINSKMTVEYPEGLDFFSPAVITVTGRNGASILLENHGGDTGPSGSGQLVYDGFVFFVDDEGFASWGVEGGPISLSGNFEGETARICAALT